MSVQSDAGGQLGALPFGCIVAGPLVAAVEAQAKAARTSIDFIQSIAYNSSDSGQKTLQTVTFSYKKSDGTQVDLSVPLLSIVPIPYIRIEEMTIAFKANISAESTTSNVDASSSSTDLKAGLNASASWGPAKFEASFNAAYSAKKDSTAAANSKYAVEYTMDIFVKACQDDIPGGMVEILKILKEGITSGSSAPAKT